MKKRAADGVQIFVCGRRQPKETCSSAHCGREAVTFCAYPIKSRLSDRQVPCGRWICEAHSVRHTDGSIICSTHAEWLRKKEAENA